MIHSPLAAGPILPPAGRHRPARGRGPRRAAAYQTPYHWAAAYAAVAATVLGPGRARPAPWSPAPWGANHTPLNQGLTQESTRPRVLGLQSSRTSGMRIADRRGAGIGIRWHLDRPISHRRSPRAHHVSWDRRSPPETPRARMRGVVSSKNRARCCLDKQSASAAKPGKRVRFVTSRSNLLD